MPTKFGVDARPPLPQLPLNKPLFDEKGDLLAKKSLIRGEGEKTLQVQKQQEGKKAGINTTSPRASKAGKRLTTSSESQEAANSNVSRSIP